MNIQRKEKGFTIIEVVLVLAIAGLIFLMVFIALPALQRNQRDTQRKNDLSRLQTALVNFSNSNRGNIPTTAQWSTFATTYMTTGGDTFIDPSGANSNQTGTAANTYQLSASTTASLSAPFAATGTSPTQNVIYYSVGYVCGSAGTDITSAGSRKVAFRMALESGGYYCVNN